MGGEKSFNKFYWQGQRPAPVIGVDEVGRGCLAGDVYAAAVILGENYPEGLTDSKKLSPARRKKFSNLIFQSCKVSIAFATLEEIAELNILHASLLAMQRAVIGLGVDGGHVLVDGNQRIPGLKTFEQTTLIKGDLRAEPIAAASIIAKVARDEEITEMAEQYPGYGFEDHKGYATQAHKEAIAKLGPCKIHRRTFAGVREFWPVTENRPTV